MIIDNLKYHKLYQGLHPGFESAFAFLQNFTAKDFKPGRIDIRGDDIFTLLSEGEGSGEPGKLEAHQKYIDLHFVVSGCDKIGFRALDKCLQPEGYYNDAGDYIFFADLPGYYITLNPGDFVICFPQDAHVPLQGRDDYRKIVIKIKIWPEKN